MEFEELSVSRLKLEVLEVCIRWSSRMEWWCTKSQHEKQSSQRKYIGSLSNARHLSSVMNFRGHIVFSSHLFRYECISPSWECKVAKLQVAFFRDQNIVKLNVQMGITSFMKWSKSIYKLSEEWSQKRHVIFQKSFKLLTFFILILNVAPQEVTKVSPLTVLKKEEVSILFLSIYDYRLVPLERVYLNNIWVSF